MALRVKMIEVDGEKRVPPEVMDLLQRLAHHKEYCKICEASMKSGSGIYCAIGREIIHSLARCPEVEFVPD
jgi:hypothetical protein